MSESRFPDLRNNFVRWVVSRRAAIISLAVVLFTHGTYALMRGPRINTETTAYEIWASRAILYGWRGMQSIGTAGFTLVAAGARLAAGAEWTWFIVTLNVLAHALLAAILIDMAMRCTRSSDAAVIAIALLVLSHDLALWLSFVLPDTTYVAIAFGVFVIAGRAVMAGSPRMIGYGAVALVFALFYRPGGLLLLPMFTVAAIAVLSPRTRERIEALSPKVVLGAAVSVAVVVILAMPLVARSGVRSETYDRAVVSLDRGIVVWDWPQTDHEPSTGYFDDVATAADRVLHFFFFWTERFSLTHNIMNAVFYMPLMILLAAGATVAMKRSSTSIVMLMSVVMILTVALYAAFFPADSQWRSRLPVLPHLILLAAIAAREIVSELGLARPTGVIEPKVTES